MTQAAGPGGLGLVGVEVPLSDQETEEVVLRRGLQLEMTLYPSRHEEACTLWPGGLVLAHYLAEGRAGQWASWLASTPRRKAIELGSGAGTAGLSAAALGAHVVATDLQECLPILDVNARNNTVVIASGGGSIEVAPLKWGDAAQIAACCARGPFDLVLLCDCMYHTGENPDVLVDTVLALPGEPQVLVCNERRARTNTIADGSKLQHGQAEDSCLALLAESFTMCQVPWEQQHPFYRNRDVEIYELSQRMQ